MVLLASEYKILQRGEEAPDFSLPGTDGKTYTISHLRGAKALLVIFMCNHCPFVLPKIEEMKRIAADYKGQGLMVLGINANEADEYPEDSFEKMQEYVQLWRLNFPYLRDESQEVAKAYGAVCTPDPFLFDAQGKLVYHGRIDDAHGKELAKVHELYGIIGEFLQIGKITAEQKPSMGCSIKWK